MISKNLLSLINTLFNPPSFSVIVDISNKRTISCKINIPPNLQESARNSNKNKEKPEPQNMC